MTIGGSFYADDTASRIVVDTDSGNDALLSGTMDELFGINNTGNHDANIYVRASSDAALVSSGWSSGNTTVFNGETYAEYTDSNMQQLYVQLVTP